MKRLVALATAVGMTWLGAVAGLGGSAQAVVPGANGRILFTRAICFSDARRCWEIVAADPDGAHETLIAGPYRRKVWDDHFIANWSPDGKTVIFMAKQAIWEVNADGTGLHVIWRPPNDGSGIDDGPAFTPDGRHIIFTRCCPRPTGYGLWRINADGSRLRVVTRELAGGPKVDAPIRQPASGIARRAVDHLPPECRDVLRSQRLREPDRHGQHPRRQQGPADGPLHRRPDPRTGRRTRSGSCSRCTHPMAGPRLASSRPMARASGSSRSATRRPSASFAELLAGRDEDHLLPLPPTGMPRPVHDESGREWAEQDHADRVHRAVGAVGGRIEEAEPRPQTETRDVARRHVEDPAGYSVSVPGFRSRRRTGAGWVEDRPCSVPVEHRVNGPHRGRRKLMGKLSRDPTAATAARFAVPLLVACLAVALVACDSGDDGGPHPSRRTAAML